MNISVLGVYTNTNNIITFKFMYFFMLSQHFVYIFDRKNSENTCDNVTSKIQIQVS